MYHIVHIVSNLTSLQGDSGVPLMCNRNGYWFVSGLVSWGSWTCGEKPTIFSNIARMRNWITYALRRVGNFILNL